MNDEERQALRKLTDAVGAILQAHLTTTTMIVRQVETEHRNFIEQMALIAAKRQEAEKTNAG